MDMFHVFYIQPELFHIISFIIIAILSCIVIIGMKNKGCKHMLSISAVILFGLIWIGSRVPVWFEKLDACEYDPETKRCIRCLNVGDKTYTCDRLESDNGHIHIYEVCTIPNNFDVSISVCNRGETKTIKPNENYTILRCKVCGHIHTDDDVIILK